MSEFGVSHAEVTSQHPKREGYANIHTYSVMTVMAIYSPSGSACSAIIFGTRCSKIRGWASGAPRTWTSRDTCAHSRSASLLSASACSLLICANQICVFFVFPFFGGGFVVVVVVVVVCVCVCVCVCVWCAFQIHSYSTTRFFKKKTFRNPGSGSGPWKLFLF